MEILFKISLKIPTLKLLSCLIITDVFASFKCLIKSNTGIWLPMYWVLVWAGGGGGGC